MGARRIATANWLVLGSALCGVTGCNSIPTTAVTLSDELQQYQAAHVEHLDAIAGAYAQILDEELRRQLVPLANIEKALELELFRVEGMLEVEPDATQAVPSPWAGDPIVEAFRQELQRQRTNFAPWEPWVARVRSYQLMLSAMRDPVSNKAPYSAVILQDSTMPQAIVVAGLLEASAGGVPFPAAALRRPLQRDESTFTGNVTDANARRVGDKADILMDAVLTASKVDLVEPFLSGLRDELVSAQASRQALIARVRADLSERRGVVGSLRAQALQDLETVRSNALELERGLDALSTGLRRGSEAFYRPKNDVVLGLQSLAGNLADLGVIDHDQVTSFTAKSNELSGELDKLFGDLATLGS